MCKRICGNNCLQRAYVCAIEDNWPPSIGDKVTILEGILKGKEGKIMEIKRLNVSTNGEALLEMKGMAEPYQITMNYLVKSVEVR